MVLTSLQVEKLLKSDKKFEMLAFLFLVTRMKGLYAKDPSVLSQCTEEINVFLAKHDSIMANDREAIKALLQGGK